MRRFYLIGFLVLLAFDTLAQIGFKLAAVAAAPPQLEFAWLGRFATERWIYLAVVGYFGAFVTWMTLLRYAPIGPAFAATHLDIVTVLVVSVMWLGESLRLRKSSAQFDRTASPSGGDEGRRAGARSLPRRRRMRCLRRRDCRSGGRTSSGRRASQTSARRSLRFSASNLLGSRAPELLR